MTALLLAALLSQWPQFRGPTGQGHAEGPLPLEWSASENVLWSCELPEGRGFSSPVVDGPTVWLTTAAEDGSVMRLLGVDVEAGELTRDVELVRPADVRRIHPTNSYASPTPVIHEGRVFTHFGRYGTAAVEAKTGEVLWRNETLTVKHDGGPGSSPVVAGGVLFVTMDGADRSFVCGLDPATGGVKWTTERSAPMRPNPITHRAFATPLVLRRGEREFVVSPGPDQLHAYDPADGRSLWHVRYEGFSTVPCPAADDDRLYFCTGYFGPELAAVRLEGLLDGREHGDVTASRVEWTFRGPVPDTPSPTAFGGRVWMVSDKGVLTAVEAATGKKAAGVRVRDNVSASPLVDRASGRLYVFSEKGVATVWDATSDRPRKLATNRLPGPLKASPAAIGGTLLIRSGGRLWRVGPAGQSEPSRRD